MFSIDLIALERERTARAAAEFGPDDGLFADAGFELGAPVKAEATGMLMPSGQVMVQGTLEGVLDTACRRCLNEVEVPFSFDFTTLFVAPNEFGSETSGGEVLEIPRGAAELDLGPVVREELMLRLPSYTVCRDECAGLCASCGIDLNEETCECTVSESDPRWDALRAVTS